MVNLNLKIFGVSSRAQISMIWATFSHFPPGIEHSQPKFQRFEPRSPGSCIAALPHFSWGLFHDWPCHRRCLQLTLGLLHRSSGCQTPVGWWLVRGLYYPSYIGDWNNPKNGESPKKPTRVLGSTEPSKRTRGSPLPSKMSLKDTVAAAVAGVPRFSAGLWWARLSLFSPLDNDINVQWW